MCPRWPPQFAQCTSTRRIPKVRSSCVATLLSETGAQKLGHPLPESYFVSEEKSSVPHPAHRYLPCSFVLTYAPVKARSVPFSRSTWYCSGVSSFFQSLSTLLDVSVMGISLGVSGVEGVQVVEVIQVTSLPLLDHLDTSTTSPTSAFMVPLESPSRDAPSRGPRRAAAARRRRCRS